MAYGNVYVFNIYSQAIKKLGVNGQGSAGSIAAPNPASNRPYTPKSIAIPRTNLNLDQLNKPLIVVGNNTLTIDYQGESGTCIIAVPGPSAFPLQYDLWLYVAYKHANLYTQSGEYIPNPEATLSATDGSFPIKFSSQ